MVRDFLIFLMFLSSNLFGDRFSNFIRVLPNNFFRILSRSFLRIEIS